MRFSSLMKTRLNMKITIPKPCHENWNAMTPQEKGKFCAICAKTVRDFTHSSDQEIFDEIENSQQKICGRFNESQINRPLEFSFLNSLLAKFSVGLVMTTAGITKINAQVCKPEPPTSKQQKIVGEVAIAQPKKDTINRQFILGKVVAQPIEKYEPLYVLDGKVITAKTFKSINQKTIKSMEVVKGKKAIAIFGEKAKNGVILINTK